MSPGALLRNFQTCAERDYERKCPLCSGFGNGGEGRSQLYTESVSLGRPPPISAYRRTQMFEQAAPRYDLNLHLEVSVGNETTVGRSKDLSVSGIGAYIPYELAVGQYVNLSCAFHSSNAT